MELIRTILVATALLAAAAHGEVSEVTAGGFVSRNVLRIDAPPAATWQGLVDIAHWWDPAHTYSGSAANLSLQARPGGCFCETLPAGGVEHMRVVYVQPPHVLRMRGALGPLQEHALTGALTWTLQPAGQYTELTVVYRVGGYLPAGMAQWAEAVDGVLASQAAHLKQLVEAAPPPGGRHAAQPEGAP